MRWLSNILRRVGYEKNAMYDPLKTYTDRAKDNGKQGGGKDTINIRILYPHHDDNIADIADFFGWLLYHILDENKGSLERSYRIGKVIMDRQESGDNDDDIFEQIQRRDVIIFMIITEDAFDTLRHKKYYRELEECIRQIDIGVKYKRLFIPVIICEKGDANLRSVELKKFISFVEDRDLHRVYISNNCLSKKSRDVMPDMWVKIEKEFPRHVCR